MGKVSKWFIALFGLNKKTKEPNSARKPSKKHWPSVKYINNNDKDYHHHHKQAVVTPAETGQDDHLNKQPPVVRLTSRGRTTPTNLNSASFGGATAAPSGGGGGSHVAYVSRSEDSYGGREVRAAVKIQSHFRAYLSRRALRALKSLVKFQALVRGNIVRKQTADNIRRVHVLLGLQARALAKRSHMSSGELNHLDLFHHPEDGYYYTTLTPTTSDFPRSDFSRSDESSFSEHPNYMSYTKSSKAKMRSLSAPKQRSSQYERLNSSSERRGYPSQTSNGFRFNDLQAKFANKLYPGSGRLGNNLGVAN